MAYPATFRYTKQHEWTDVKGEVATIGITDYAQHELGDVVFAELPKVGAKVESGIAEASALARASRRASSFSVGVTAAMTLSMMDMSLLQ